MLKRVRWLAIGMGLGVWAQRRLKLLVRSYTPPEIATRAARRSTEMAGRKAGDVRSAFVEGRDAMRRREAELRQKVNGEVADVRDPPPVHDRPRRDR